MQASLPIKNKLFSNEKFNIFILFISVNIFAQTTPPRATIIDGSVVIQAEDADIIDGTRVEDVTYKPF